MKEWAMPERFQVRVTKDHLVFCSGHFISYEGDKCERLHGHNYRAAVEIEGELDENHYVFDFIALKRSRMSWTTAGCWPRVILSSWLRRGRAASASAIGTANGCSPAMIAFF